MVKNHSEENAVEEEEEVTEELAEERPFLHSVSGMAPWWVVSILMHLLIIALASLISMSMKMPNMEDAVVMTTEMEARPEINRDSPKPQVDSKNVLDSNHDTQATDPTSNEASDIVVPPDILVKAELGDHWETINPDKEDTHSAFGNPDAHMFHSIHGCDEAAGGGGNQGLSLDDVIGFGGQASPGSGGGWGGGHGTGIGVDDGSGRGSFGQRNGGGRKLMVKRHGGSKATEDAVGAALRWLAYHQEVDGHWNCKKYDGTKVDTAVTSLALLAFLGAGHTEKVGEWKDNVTRAVKWLKSKQAPNGLIWDTTDEGGNKGIGYPGAMAALAMAEAAGMANMPETRTAAQSAINYCCDVHQMGEGSDKAGWRYSAKQAGDISVTGWFIMALKSAKVAGLHVNPASFEGGLKFLNTVEQKNVGGGGAYGAASAYLYTPGGDSNRRRCAIGNLARQFLGFKKEDLQSSVEYFVNQGVPEWGANGESVDLYYWYYGTLCVFQQGGDLWKKWNGSMKKTLVENQVRGKADTAGSWNPVGDYSGDWGRVGQTALSALCLEVYYRYIQLQPDK